MGVKKQNLSELNAPLPSAEEMMFGIVVSEWNNQITDALLAGAVKVLKNAGCLDHNIKIKYVPGSFELPLAAQFFAENTEVDAVIALGCVIQGETKHFDFVSQGVAMGITQVMLTWSIPIAFGVLTTDTIQQALDRAGGKYGNKGDEAAATAIKMVKIQKEVEEMGAAVEPSQVS